MADSFSTLNYFTEESFFGPNSSGFARTNRFKLEIISTGNVNTKLNNAGPGFKMLQNNIISANLPSFGLTDQATPFSHIVTRKTESQNVSLKFWESNNLEIKIFIQQWMKLFKNDFKNQSSGNAWYGYQTNNFFDDCVATMKISHMPYGSDQSDKMTTDYFYKVFPITCGNINYNVSQDNQLAEIDVTFKYVFHDVEEVQN